MDMSEKIIACIFCIIVILFCAVLVISVNDKNECESNGGVYVAEYGSSIYRCVKLERINKPYADDTNR